jgi:Glycosyltransferase Family 4
MRVLIAVVNFRFLTGAELYVYELSRSLALRGHDVTVVSETGGLIAERARGNGVKAYAYDELPADAQFDVMHVQELAPARWAMDRFPDVPAVATVHSQWPCENPLIDPRIYKYVCIRPEVREKIVREDGIPAEKTTVIYNGVDFSRFNRDGAELPERDMVLFAGTVDPLRRAAALDVIERSVAEDFDVLFIGTRHSTHLDGELPDNVRWIGGDVWDIERYVKRCTATAGIVLGRTTLEGWACGKPGWIYDIELDGSIRSRDVYTPPHKDILQQFDIEYMTDELELLYREAVAAPRDAVGGPSGSRLASLDAVRRRPLRVDVDPHRVAVLAFAQEVLEDASLLDAWGHAHHGHPDATLVLYAEGEVSEGDLVAALDRSGLGEADVLLVVADPRESLAAAAERFAFVLSNDAPRRPLARVLHLGAAELQQPLDAAPVTA